MSAAGKRDARILKKKIGVLSLQGCVQAHRKHIEALGATFQEVKYSEDFQSIDALILPGGESSVILKNLELFQMFDELKNYSLTHPVWGICAGAILLSSAVRGSNQKSLGVVDCEVERNAYGRQSESFVENFEGESVAFIRAPKIVSFNVEASQILATHKGETTALRQGNKMISSFHPELSEKTPSKMHQLFFETLS